MESRIWESMKSNREGIIWIKFVLWYWNNFRFGLKLICGSLTWMFSSILVILGRKYLYLAYLNFVSVFPGILKHRRLHIDSPFLNWICWCLHHCFLRFQYLSEWKLINQYSLFFDFRITSTLKLISIDCI